MSYLNQVAIPEAGFTGSNYYNDNASNNTSSLVRNFVIQHNVIGNSYGYEFAGDFDGDGLEDLASIIDQGVDGPGVGIYFNSTAVVVNCPEDIDGDGSIAVGDLLAIISAWGTNDPSADVNNDGVVDVSDLLTVVASWGPCP